MEWWSVQTLAHGKTNKVCYRACPDAQRTSIKRRAFWLSLTQDIIT